MIAVRLDGGKRQVTPIDGSPAKVLRTREIFGEHSRALLNLAPSPA